MSAPDDPCQTKCGGVLVDRMKAMGIAVFATTEPPLVVGPFTMPALICPHRRSWWIEPTGEQIAQWARDKVE